MTASVYVFSVSYNSLPVKWGYPQSARELTYKSLLAADHAEVRTAALITCTRKSGHTRISGNVSVDAPMAEL